MGTAEPRAKSACAALALRLALLRFAQSHRVQNIFSSLLWWLVAHSTCVIRAQAHLLVTQTRQKKV